jgi:DNA invertase Pin-like site-specific DNA recombinase
MGLDTGNATGRLMLSVLASVAEFEVEIMKERQAAGIAKAKAEGKYQGRPSSIDRDAVKALLDAKENPTVIARTLKIGRDSVYRIKKELEAS